MAKRRRRGGSSPDETTARRQAALEYAPQRSDIRSTLQDLAAARDSDIQGARGAARGIVTAARQARPQVQGDFRSVLAEASRDNGAINSDLGSLGSGASLIRSFARGEQRGAQRRTRETLSGLLGELAARQSGAMAGAAFQEGKARSDYAAAAGKAHRQLQSLSREQGARAGVILGQLQAERAKMEFEAQQKALDRQNRLDAANIRSSRSGASKTKPLSAAAQRKVTADVFHARGLIDQLRQAGKPLDTIRSTLRLGVKGKQVTIPSFSDDVLNAAFDLALYGGVGKTHSRVLGMRLPGVKVLPDRRAPSRLRIAAGSLPAVGPAFGR